MKTTAAIRTALRRPLLLAALAGSLTIAFLAGATTAHTLLAPYPVDRALATTALPGSPAWQPDEHAIGRDIYSPRHALGRLVAVFDRRAGQGAYALIATYDRDAQLAGEIAVPMSRLDLQGERLVLSSPAGDPPDGEARRWRM
jgi:hypothetical protein